jgi:uncharacterized protein YjbI with pentapeptide repeats
MDALRYDTTTGGLPCDGYQPDHLAFLNDRPAGMAGIHARRKIQVSCCQNTDFSGADLRYASMVNTNFKGKILTDVQVFGISAWGVETDADTRHDLIVGANPDDREAPLRAHDLRTA